jgi:hypothetical protein
LKSAIGLAEALDWLAVRKDTPDYRSLADSLRLLTLPMPTAGRLPPGFVRTAKSLLRAEQDCEDNRIARPAHCSELGRLVTVGVGALAP